MSQRHVLCKVSREIRKKKAGGLPARFRNLSDSLCLPRDCTWVRACLHREARSHDRDELRGRRRVCDAARRRYTYRDIPRVIRSLPNSIVGKRGPGVLPVAKFRSSASH
ncbi:hypothetical protein MRX96_054693 [Rhipicephalus microplus]